jgi:class 3 adenylate cyclase
MENPKAARFCMACAAPLVVDRPPERRERRLVSVLFADLVGYTSRSEDLDVEDVDSVLAPYHRLLKESVEQTGGVVAKLMGDGVMALFGALAAHEDDPERALRCAIAIRDTLAGEAGPGRLHVRVGVTTGEALVVRSAGGAADAVGDVVNTAARLEAAAPVDGVLVDARTFRAASHAIRFQESAPVSAKGKATPIPAWLAVAPQSALPARAAQVDLALVGRERELGRLVELLDRCVAGPSAELVTVVGVPGIGKSRLVRELERRAARHHRPVRWLRGRSPAYGEGIAFWALGEMVKREAGIRESDPPATAVQRLAESVDQMIGEDDRRWVARHLRPLVGLDVEGGPSAPAGRVEAFAAWRTYFQALAADRPTVLVFEDLHWADAAVREFVDLLAARAGRLPLLVVCTARPELLEQPAGWGEGLANAALVTLSPLSSGATGRLVDELLDQVPLPAAARRSLLDRAEGNPLFAQEYVRMLRDGGLLVQRGGSWHVIREPDSLPDSLQAIIAARLDLLAEDERQLVQDAAVIGRTAWTGALCELSGRRRPEVEALLDGLERTQLVHRSGGSALEGEREVRFAHALVQDVAYSQIRRADRAERHLRAAAWLERHAGTRDDRAELLAHHYSTALRISRERGVDTRELTGRARGAHIAAGRHADAVQSYEAAARHYAAASALMASDDSDRPAVLLAHAVAAFRSADADAADLLQAAFDAHAAAGDWWSAAEAAQLLGDWNREVSGDLAAAARWWDEAGVLAERSGHRHLRVRVADGQAARLTEERCYAEAAALADQAAGEARAAGDREGIGLLLVRGGYARVCGGDSGGVQQMREATRILAEAGSRYVAWAYIDLSLALMMLGDLPAALGACEQGLEWAERFGEPRVIGDAEARRAFLAYQTGDWQTAREITDRSMETANRWSAAFIIWTHGLIAIAEGDEETARADDEALRRFGERVPSARAMPPLARRHGEAEAAPGQPAGPAQAPVQGYRNWEIFASLELMAAPAGHGAIVELAARMPDDNPWREALIAIAEGGYAEAAGIFDAIGSQSLAAQARMIAAERGAPADAGREAARALEFYERVGATRHAEQARELLQGGPLSARLDT